jgi:hypothetical protein
MMRRGFGGRTYAIATAVLLTLAPVLAARAQVGPAPPESTLLPEIQVRPPSALPKGAGTNNQGGAGASDKEGDAKSLERLNRELKRKVDQVNPTFNTPPFDATSPDPRIGIINIPGVQQQYGKNFGNSAFPYRPPPPVFTPPLGHR